MKIDIYFRNALVVFIIMIFMSAGMHAQKSMREVWVTMPDSVIPYLNQKLRAELIDYWDMKAEAKVKNILGGNTKLEELNDKFMAVKLNGNTDVSFRLLNTADSSYIICMVKTISAPAKESTVSLYSSDWQPLNGEYGLSMGHNADDIKSSFIMPRDTMAVEQYNKLCAMVEPVMVAAELNKDEDSITFSLSTPFITKKEKEELFIVLRQRKLKWDGKTFKEC